MQLNEEFWNSRYKTGETGWDIGEISPPLKAYFDQLTDKNLKILIPGGGNAYEVEYLHRQGFKNVYLLDIASEALKRFKNRVPDFPGEHLVHSDFLKHQGQYDRIIEQTFFCALDPSLRKAYAKKMAELLKPGGKLVGLLFDDPLHIDHPPFGGNREEYLGYFKPYFNIIAFESANNSIAPRADRELFIILEKS